MSVSQHRHKDAQNTQNQNNQMSEDPRDGSRDSFTVGKDGKEPQNVPPERKKQDQSQIEAFGEEGAGIASKE
ncbi:MAG: hypothetical protein M3N07_03550 [Pseudomonadota bacterium]|nr:hypothetical protein [Pseudomonadota bacterium]